MKLRKRFFSRNKDRQASFGDTFTKTALGLNSLYLILGIFTPAVIATSMISKDIVLMLANIFLGTGYSSNFLHRLFSKKISMAEFIISAVFLSTAIIALFYFFPVALVWSTLSIISCLNHVAIAINAFFLFSQIIVPPCKSILEYCARKIGLNIGGNCYSEDALTFKTDEHVINRLIEKHCNKAPKEISEEDKQNTLQRFNHLLDILVSYVNKYNDKFLGSLANKEQIDSTNSLIKQLTKGNATNCITFIETKISFKKSNIGKLKKAEKQIKSATLTEKKSVKSVLGFFAAIDDKQFNTEKEREQLKTDAITCLKKEIKRQETKIQKLEQCLPLKL